MMDSFKNIILTAAVFIVLSLVLMPHSASGFGFSSLTTSQAVWSTYRNNPQHTGLTSQTLEGNIVKLMWKFSAGSGVASSISIGDDGTLYFTSWDHYFYAVCPNGTLKWKVDLGDSTISSPAIEKNGTVYVGGSNYLYAINKYGVVIWKAYIGDSVISSPVVASDGTIYIGADSYNMGSPGILCAVSPDGTVKWKFQIYGDPGENSPAIGKDGTIYITSGYGIIYAVNPDGSERWRYEVGGIILSSPTIGDDGTVYFPMDNTLFAFNPNGTEKWNYTPENSYLITSDISIDALGNLYGVYDTEPDSQGNMNSYLFGLTPDEHLLWRLKFKTEGYSCAISYDGTIVFGDFGGTLHGVKKGVELWNFTANGYIVATPTIGANNTIYVGDTSGHVYSLHVISENFSANIPAKMENTQLLWIGAGAVTSATVIAVVVFMRGRKRKKYEYLK